MKRTKFMFKRSLFYAYIGEVWIVNNIWNNNPHPSEWVDVYYDKTI
jgi:hypothetical protein